MDIIYINQLIITTTVGVYEWEQNIKQKLILDIEMGWDNIPAANSDNVEYCLNYAKVSESIIKYTSTNKFVLLERVAEEIAELLLNNFNLPWVRIKVNKPNALVNASYVGTIIERTK